MASEATTETESTVERGLDVEQYRAFIEFVRENPDAARGELRAVGEYEGTAYHTATHFGPFVMGGEEGGSSRDYTLHVGVPGEFEANVGFVEPVDRMESVEVALGALTTCITNTISRAALVEGIDVEHVATSVSVPSTCGYSSVSCRPRSARRSSGRPRSTSRPRDATWTTQIGSAWPPWSTSLPRTRSSPSHSPPNRRWWSARPGRLHPGPAGTFDASPGAHTTRFRSSPPSSSATRFSPRISASRS